MTINFPYPGYERIPPLDVPDHNLMAVLSPRSVSDADESAALRHGFESPFGAPRLRRAVQGAQHVLVLIDDATRNTPTARILPHLLAELHAAGVADDRIEFLQAPGTHRPMTTDELKG